jgi:ferrous iron transport protein B
MATRTIENRKDRLATILVAPFMSCSARLPVYTLLIGVFFSSFSAWGKAGIMLGLYATGIIAAATCAFLLKRSILRGPAPAFILELPTYKFPQLSQVSRQVFVNSYEFLRRAGTIIFTMSVILWAMSYYPRLPESQAQNAAAQAQIRQITPEAAIAAAQSEYSIAGRFGHALEPVLQPLGYDWKIGVGLIGAFAAREVFVSTVAITYAAGEEGTGLADAMRNDVYPPTAGSRAGQHVWTPLIGVSVLVWFVLAMQCMSTVAVVRRETGTWKWPLFMLAYMNALAYVICLLIYQVGSRI